MRRCRASRATTPALALSFLGLDAADTWTADPDQTQVAYQSDAAAGVALGSAQELVTAPKAPPDLTTLGWSGTVAIQAGMIHAVFEEDTSGPPPGGGGGDPAGAEEYYAYGPFGEGSDAGNGTIAYRYAGHRFDPETGLYYMRARYYSVKAGRFLSPDPIGYDDGPNIYAYTGNDPVNYIDLDGLGRFKPVTSPIVGLLRSVKRVEHHMVPTEILNKYLPKNIANHPLVRGTVGKPNKWMIPEDLHIAIHNGKNGAPGKWNQRWKEELRKVDPRQLDEHKVVEIRDKLAKEFDLEKYRPGIGPDLKAEVLRQLKNGIIDVGIGALLILEKIDAGLLPAARGFQPLSDEQLDKIRA